MRTIRLSTRRRLRTRAAFALFGLASVIPIATVSAAPVAAQSAPTLSVNDVSVNEGNIGGPAQNAVFTVSLSAAQPAAISFRATTADGTGPDAAIAGSDYTTVNRVFLIPAGATSTSVSVPILSDNTFEPDETFTLNLSGSVVTIARPTGTATVVNDDAFPALRIGDATITEGSLGTVLGNVTVSMSNPTSQTVTFRASTADGPAPDGARSGEDYTSFNTVFTIAPGQVSRLVPFTIRGDNKHEANETFLVNLSAAVNATIADNQAVVTIRNDDPVPTVSIQGTSVTEGNSGTRTALLRVRLTNPTSSPVSVNFATANDSAIAPSDYLSNSGTVTLAPGTTSANIAVQVNGDVAIEGNEVFHVILSSPVNAILGDATGDVTIVNDDP